VTRGGALGMIAGVFRAVPGFALGILICGFGPGCSSGTETGNPSFTAELSYTAYSSAPAIVGVHTAASRARVESAWLDLDRVALSTAGSCALAAPTQIKVPALGVGDHASGVHHFTRFEVDPSAFCALDLPFVQAPGTPVESGEPPSLEQHSIMIAGALPDGTPFTVLSAATPTLHLVAEQGSFEMGMNNAQMLITFDLAAWLDLDFDSATRSAGEIVISADQNPLLLAQFESNLASGVALYRDRDGDGTLDVSPERLAHGQ